MSGGGAGCWVPVLVEGDSATTPETATEEEGLSDHAAVGVVPVAASASVACAAWLLPASLTVAPSVAPEGALASPCQTLEPSAKIRRSPRSP